METNKGEWIYGRRPVIEVLRAGRRLVYDIVQTAGKDSAETAEIAMLARDRGLMLKTAKRDELDQLALGGNHQGVAIRTGGFPYVCLEEIIHDLRKDPNGLVLLLDHIEDPQNVGSLLRSADAAGVNGVILPEDRAAGLTPAAVRASAGASEHLRVAKVVNLVRAMRELKEENVWLTGLDMGDDARPYTEVDFTGRAGIVVGAEGQGLGRLVRETCDFVACLPMRGKVESLNAGVAGGIALFEVLRQRGIKS